MRPGRPGDDLPLERLGLALTRVREDAVAHLVREIERLRDAQRLLVVSKPSSEATPNSVVERVLAGMPERSVPHVVPEPDRLRQVLVQPEGASDDARDRRRLERMRHARPVVVALRVDEDLRLPLEPPERLRVHDPVAVALEFGADAARVFRQRAPARLERAHGVRRQALLERSDPRLERHRVSVEARGAGSRRPRTARRRRDRPTSSPRLRARSPRAPLRRSSRTGERRSSHLSPPA